MFNKIFHVLRKLNIVYSKAELAQTRLKPKFISSKMGWTFETIFAVSGDTSLI